MARSLAHRLFGFGKIPRKMRPILEQEGIVLLDEGISGSITLRNYKAPGRRHGYRKSWFAGSVVITQLRVAAFSGRRSLINLPLEEAHLRKLSCAVDNETTLVIEFDAAVFDERASGSVALRFSTDKARLFLERLEGLGVSRREA